MHAWTSRMLVVDLSSGKIEKRSIEHEILKNYVGGRGLGVKIYTEMAGPEIEPFDESNPLVFTVGPLTGLAPMSGRHSVVSKSPLTGTILDSNSGGFWGKELHYAGYDALVVKGRADRPVYIRIRDDEISIEDASHLWGKNVQRTWKVWEVWHA